MIVLFVLLLPLMVIWEDGEKILTALSGRDTINTTEPGKAGGKDGII